MTDLADWLRQQVDDDERMALATTLVPVPGEWKASRDKYASDDAPLYLIQGDNEDEPGHEGYFYGHEIIVFAADWHNEAEANLRHIARHDPARVLREVTAKRAILDAHQYVPAVQQNDDHRYTFGCQTCHADTHCGETMGLGWCDTIKALAEIFADRPGYKWALWTGLGQ